VTVITLRGVAAGYGPTPVLRDVTAAIPRTGVTALVGPNGAGKSTLLGLLARVISPTAGDIGGLGPRRPAFVVQRAAVSDTLPLTVREAVAMGRWAHRGFWRPLTAHDRSVIAASMARLGVSDLATRQLGDLSGGQRQRVLVAQGLAQQPDLLLLDEPAAGLDLEAQRRVADVLEAAGRDGTTVVHATHDLDLALRGDHCLLLGDGRLLAQGDPASVLTPAALERAWGIPRPGGVRRETAATGRGAMSDGPRDEEDRHHGDHHDEQDGERRARPHPARRGGRDPGAGL
jgi:zinc/manganese transport system ATP-binding protein